MKRFLLFTVRLIASLTLLVTVLIGIARMQPVPALLTDEIKTCDGQICARKVILSETTLGDAQAVLDADPDVAAYRNYGEISASTKNGTLIFAVGDDDFTDQATIGNLEVDFWNDATTNYPLFGEFIARYGPPCKVTVDLGAHLAMVYYPRMYLLFEQNDGNIVARVPSLSPYQSVGSTLSYNDPDFCTLNDPNNDKPWKGFMTATGYAQHP